MNVDIYKLRREVEKALMEKNKCIYDINKSQGKKYFLLREKFKAINEKYWLLQEKLDYYESNLVATSDELDIKRFGNELESMYGIYLKDQGIKIGHIDYRGHHTSPITGDIGYVIDYRFKGHNYAYKALCLLADYLNRNNISDFYISVLSDNIPSIKTIEKYGGVIIRKDNRISTYECITKRINNEKNL